MNHGVRSIRIKECTFISRIHVSSSEDKSMPMPWWNLSNVIKLIEVAAWTLWRILTYGRISCWELRHFIRRKFVDFIDSLHFYYYCPFVHVYFEQALGWLGKGAAWNPYILSSLLAIVRCICQLD